MAKDGDTKKSPLAQKEEEILALWKERNIFDKTLAKESPRGEFTFYEGPPTANGRPGIHHLEARAFKDVIPRYKTMQGFHVRRKAGWDTHGLPVELEVEKKLGLKSKKEIEEYGIAKFNEECKKSVWTYVDLWKTFTDRMGYWIDLKNPYVTYESEYIESVWNILGKVNEQKLLYRDYKVVPWCPRCGTAVSSHELAQGYETVKDLSVYVKFKIVGFSDAYFMAWTTTPWTLPGNVALAVGKDITYVEAKVQGEILVLAKDKLELLPEGYEVVAEHKGSEMVGMEYEPLYPYLKDALPEEQKENLKKAFKVYEADFVTTEDGTGIVHTAVMYGQDDFELGTSVGLPKHHLVDETGKFVKGTDFLEGRFVKDEEVAVDIIKDLAHKNLLFKKEKYEHTYPFCWRCKTPIIYYARNSWYIAMSKLRKELLKENEGINWEPNHIKDGRFGEWLREVKDWAISRERYWGTPLPIWTDEEKNEVLVIDSLETLNKRIKSNGNKFIFLRHAEAESNVKKFHTCDEKADIKLTEEGVKQAKKAGQELKSKNISAVYSSPFVRTKQTAELVCEELDFPKEKIVFDQRIREIDFGDLNNKSHEEYSEYWEKNGFSLEHKMPNGESYLDAKRRFAEFIYKMDEKHENETILVVTHGVGIEVAPAIINGPREAEDIIDQNPPMAGFREYEFSPLPHNENFELDLHRPYIDEVVLLSDSGKEMRRVKEVLDVWFDSGAMPFAQDHYPFDKGELKYPADYICEAIDQTRGWFYTLHAIGVLVEKGKAFENVICLGHILDKDGQKMSKSKGNTVDPFEMMDQFGADALRYWMYTVNQPGESKNFDLATVEEVVKKVFNLLLNTLAFYELYPPKGDLGEPELSNPLDFWIMARLKELSLEVNRGLENYKVLEGARPIRDFIADLSQWYVRRSRDRFKGDDEKDTKEAQATLRKVFFELSRLMAPFMPLLAEDVYQRAKNEKDVESVHLLSWSEAMKLSLEEEKAISLMQEVRDTVSLGLEARAKAQIKTRQPLASLTLKSKSLEGKNDLLNLIMDEVNVKSISFDGSLSEEVLLDTEISPELQREGDSRELIRRIQDLRKERGLSPSDKIVLKLQADEAGRRMIEEFRDDIAKVCVAKELVIEEGKNSEIKIDF